MSLKVRTAAEFLKPHLNERIVIESQVTLVRKVAIAALGALLCQGQLRFALPAIGLSLCVGALTLKVYLITREPFLRLCLYFTEPSRIKLTEHLEAQYGEHDLKGELLKQLLRVHAGEAFQIKLLSALDFNQLTEARRFLGTVKFTQLLAKLPQKGYAAQLWRSVEKFMASDDEEGKEKLKHLSKALQGKDFKEYVLTLKEELTQEGRYEDFKTAFEEAAPFLTVIHPIKQVNTPSARRLAAYLQATHTPKDLKMWIEDLRLAGESKDPTLIAAVENALERIVFPYTVGNLKQIVSAYNNAKITSPKHAAFKADLQADYENHGPWHQPESLARAYRFAQEFQLSEYQAVALQVIIQRGVGVLCTEIVFIMAENLAHEDFLVWSNNWIAHHHQGMDYETLRKLYKKFQPLDSQNGKHIMAYLRQRYKDLPENERLAWYAPLDTPPEFRSLA